MSLCVFGLRCATSAVGGAIDSGSRYFLRLNGEEQQVSAKPLEKKYYCSQFHACFFNASFD